MEGTAYLTKDAILQKANEIIGIPMRDIDKTGRIKTGKGAIGTVVEESWFGYTPNSESEPDFPEAGVELKVTPYIKKNGEIRAKERLVCNIINYMTEYKQTLRTSAFWHKCQTMLLMSYEHQFDVPKCDYTIDKAILFSFPERDLAIIEHDWNVIMDKVRAGKAHLISEGDTMYLAACTKGVNAKSTRPQPFSDIPAKQRAYSLKASYMTYILRSYIFGNKKDENIIKDPKELYNQSFEQHILNTIAPYFGKTQEELQEHFGTHCSAKNLNEVLLARMLGVSGKIAYTEEFQKASIVPKTIRVQLDGSIRENMSFPTFNFIELSQETWEDSTLRNYLAPTKFLFVIFQENKDGRFVFDRIKFWNIPEDDLEEVHHVWERTVNAIRKGVQLTETSRGVLNNLPKSTESRVAHVRPHGRNGMDRLPLPDGRMMAKQCFWLNNTYIAEQIKR